MEWKMYIKVQPHGLIDRPSLRKSGFSKYSRKPSRSRSMPMLGRSGIMCVCRFVSCRVDERYVSQDYDGSSRICFYYIPTYHDLEAAVLGELEGVADGVHGVAPVRVPRHVLVDALHACRVENGDGVIRVSYCLPVDVTATVADPDQTDGIHPTAPPTHDPHAPISMRVQP